MTKDNLKKYYAHPAKFAISSDLEAIEHSIAKCRGRVIDYNGMYEIMEEVEQRCPLATVTCALCCRSIAIINITGGEQRAMCGHCPWKKIRGKQCAIDIGYNSPKITLETLESLRDFLVKHNVKNFDDIGRYDE